MTKQTMEDAILRFNAGLEALVEALERRKASEDQLGRLEEDLHLMALDRAGLARKLDETLNRAQNAESLRDQVGQRLDATLVEIDTLIARAEVA